MSAQTSLNLPMGDTHNMSYKRKTFDCMQRDVSFATLITDSCSFPKSLTVSGGVSLRRERKIGISRKLEKMWKLWNIRKKFTNVHHLHIFPAQKKQRKQLFQIFFSPKEMRHGIFNFKNIVATRVPPMKVFLLLLWLFGVVVPKMVVEKRWNEKWNLWIDVTILRKLPCEGILKATTCKTFCHFSYSVRFWTLPRWAAV